MGTVQRAAVGGLAGTIAMGTLLVLLEVQMRARLLLFDAVARFFQVPGRADLGVAPAGLFGVVVWPPIFAAVEPHLPPEDPAVSGMVFAAGLWVAFVALATTEVTVVLLPLYLTVTLLAHLVYGFTLGTVYGWTPASDGDAPAPDVEGSGR